jgi:2-polyprenyl-3-methyl-5-hydroxy-6-metoxy-1,4-benzoquinol methylase
LKYLFKNIESCPFCDSHEFKILGKRLNASQGRNPKKKCGITTTIVKCTNCELIFPNPLPIPEDIKDHYDIPPEDYWTPEYFIIPDNYLIPLVNWMNSLQKIEKNAKILDIGAGFGKLMIAFQRLGYDTYGLEPSIPFYNYAIEKMGIDEDKLQLKSVEDSDFEENTFDVIFITAVFEHLYEPAVIFDKMMKWLKPNGLIFIEVPSSRWLVNKIANRYYRLFGSDYVSNLSPMHPPFHLYEFSKKVFELHSLNNSYEIADHRYYVCETFLPKILNPILPWFMKKTNTGMELAIWLRKKK